MFSLEREMIPILREDLSRIFDSAYSAEEFVSGNGRPDLVFARKVSGCLPSRVALPDYQTLHLLVKHLNRENKIIHVDDVFALRVGDRRRVQTIIDTLSDQGFIEYKNDNEFIVRRKYSPIVEDFVSVEAKLSDWKSGLFQAVRYKSFSNSSYVALSEECINNVDKTLLREYGIGLISVSNEGASIIVKARKNKPQSIVSHYYLCERLANAN